MKVSFLRDIILVLYNFIFFLCKSESVFFFLRIWNRVIIKLFLATHLEIPDTVILLHLFIHFEVIALIFGLPHIFSIVIKNDPLVIRKDKGIIGDCDLSDGEKEIVFVQNIFDHVV